MCYAEPVTQHHALDIPTCLVTITLPITRTHKVLPETNIPKGIFVSGITPYSKIINLQFDQKFVFFHLRFDT